MRSPVGKRFHTKNRRSAYTLAELMLLVALAAILVAIFIDIRRQFSVYSRWIMSISMSGDGSRVAAGMLDGSVRVWDTRTAAIVGSLLPAESYPPIPANVAALSPDGSLIARFRGEMQVVDVSTGKARAQRAVGSGASALVGGLAFSSDGRQLAYEFDCLNPNTLRIVDLSNPAAPDIQPTVTTATTSGGTIMMSFAPDGKALYSVKSNGDFVAWDIASGQLTSSSLVPATKNAILYTAGTLSPTGNEMAVARSEYAVTTTAAGAIKSVAPTAATWFVDVFDPRNPGSRRQIVSRQEPIASVAYVDSGKSLAILSGDGVEIWDTEAQIQQKSLSSEQYFTHMAASANGRVLAVADTDSIYLLEADKLRKLVDLQPAASNLVSLFVAFVVVFGIWAVMRRRRTARTCPQCGKTLQKRRRKRTSDAEACPDCRMETLSTKELAAAAGKQGRRTRVALGLVSAGIVVLLALHNYRADGSALNLFESLGFVVAGVIGLMAVLIALFIWARRRALRRLQDEEYALRQARRMAGSEGRVERSGEVLLWTDAALPLLPGEGGGEGACASCRAGSTETSLTADWLAAELDDCRNRLEQILGMRCRPQERVQLYVHAKIAAAQRFSPLGGPNPDRPAVYCGPLAHVGYLWLDAARGLLVPPEQSLRALLSYHLAGWPRGQAGFWLGLGLANYVGRATLGPGPDAWRRKVALWAAEGTLMPLKDVFKRRAISVSAVGIKRMLPERYQSSLRVIQQLLSLVDYLATVDRKTQFQGLWRALGHTRSIEKACTQALGHRLAELDEKWKCWTQKAEFGPPPLPPDEIGQAAEELVIPLLRDASAPIQRRIRAIRILGGCGWLVGADALVETLSSSHDDLRSEALSALRLMFGRSDIERADDWRWFLEQLHGGTRTVSDAHAEHPLQVD
jgi:WD40 repeat protein